MNENAEKRSLPVFGLEGSRLRLPEACGSQRRLSDAFMRCKQRPSKFPGGGTVLQWNVAGGAIALTLVTHGDVGCLDQGCDAVSYLKPHLVHRARGDDCGHVADGGLHDDLTQYFVRDYLLDGARYFVANRLFHKVIVLFRHALRNRDLPLHCVFDLQRTVDDK
jgi:hypothetical protein